MCSEKSRGGYVLVGVNLTSTDGESRIEIADRGPGIPDAHRDRIFDRFFSYRPGGEWAGPTEDVGPPFPLPLYCEQLPETSFTELTRS